MSQTAVTSSEARDFIYTCQRPSTLFVRLLLLLLLLLGHEFSLSPVEATGADGFDFDALDEPWESVLLSPAEGLAAAEYTVPLQRQIISWLSDSSMATFRTSLTKSGVPSWWEARGVLLDGADDPSLPTIQLWTAFRILVYSDCDEGEKRRM
jgi:hypothetical protein